MDARMPFNASPEPVDAVGQWSERYVNIESDIPRSKIPLLEWWYSWTAPPIPPSSGKLAEREAARRGRLSSTILLILIGQVVVLALPVAILLNLYSILGFLGVGAIINIIALLLNRKGKISSAAWILIINVVVGFWGSILSYGGAAGLNANAVPLYDLTVIGVLLAVSLLPPGSTFIVALANSAFVIVSLTFAKHAPSLDELLAASRVEVYARPIVLQFIVAFVTYIWVRSATQALARADRAEVIATLEHQIAQQEHGIAQQKHQLDYSIEQIVQTLMRVANGDFNARVPLTQDNVLWSVAGALNNLLSRLQRLRHLEGEVERMRPYAQYAMQFEQELIRLRYEAMRLADALRQAKKTRVPIALQPARAGTLFDPIIAELNASLLSQSATPPDTEQAAPNGHFPQWSKPRFARTTSPLYPERGGSGPGSFFN